jgi:hypothetical protein
MERIDRHSAEGLMKGYRSTEDSGGYEAVRTSLRSRRHFVRPTGIAGRATHGAAE